MPTPTWIQNGTGHGSGSFGSGSSGSCSISASAAGSILIVTIGTFSSSVVSTVTDDKLNVYTKLAAEGGFFGNLEVWYKANATSGVTSVSYTLGSSDSWSGISVNEYSGVAATTPVDASAHSSGGGSGVITETISTSNSGDLLFFCYYQTVPPGTSVSGYTRRSTQTDSFNSTTSMQTWDKNQTGSGSTTAATGQSPSSWGAFLVGFSAGSATSSYLPQLMTMGMG